jgi:hypothetical protein
MPISDNVPERRNLVVTSIAFITFFLGDGQITNGELTLQAISITFKNTKVLIYLAWIMLLWFYIRYKQIHGGMLKTTIRHEAKSETKNPLLIAYLKRKTGMPYHDEEGFGVSKIEVENGKWNVYLKHFIGEERGENGQWKHYHFKDTNETINFSWAWAGIIRFSIYVKMAIKKPGIGSWLLPQFLFYVAVIMGISNIIW